MAYEHREGSGSLFQNDKGGNDARPDYRGDVLLDGVLYDIAGWKKQGAKGPFLSLAVKPKQAVDPQAAGGNADPGGPVDLGEEIPFGPEVR